MNTTETLVKDLARPDFAVAAARLTVTHRNGVAVTLPKLKPGQDYMIIPGAADSIEAVPYDPSLTVQALGGFHVDVAGEIVLASIWSPQFRPACADPRGMVLITGGAKPFWCDIYLMSRDGTSRAGVEIADGDDYKPKGWKNLNWQTAVDILAAQGKQLLTRAEFKLAAAGVKEKLATKTKQITTGRFDGLTSKAGLEQATGTIWVWSSEKDKDGWPYVLGGSWRGSGGAGPSCVLYARASDSGDGLGARGRCDHLGPDSPRSESGASGLSFTALRAANVARCEAVFHPVDEWSPTDWATAMAGECGEACNFIKKLRRGESIDTAEIGHELADVVIYADLLAKRLGIDLGQAVARKFNIVSDRRGSSIKLPEGR